MRRPVSLALVIIAVRPEHKPVLNDLPVPDRTGIHPAPHGGSQHAPVGIAHENGGEPVDKLSRGIIRLGHLIRIFRQQRHRGVLQVFRDFIRIEDFIIPLPVSHRSVLKQKVGIAPRHIHVSVLCLNTVRLPLDQRGRLYSLDGFVAQGKGGFLMCQFQSHGCSHHRRAVRNRGAAERQRPFQPFPVQPVQRTVRGSGIRQYRGKEYRRNRQGFHVPGQSRQLLICQGRYRHYTVKICRLLQHRIQSVLRRL